MMDLPIDCFRKCLILMGGILMLYGCSEERREQHDISMMECDVSSMIERIPETLRGIYDTRTFASNLIERIEQLPETSRRVKWYNKAIDEFSKVDISSLPYSKQYKCVRQFMRFRGEFSIAVSKYEHREYLVWWRRKLSGLKWKKTQWDRLKKAYGMEKDSIDVTPVPESVLNRVHTLKYVVEEGLEEDYHAEMASAERCWWSDRERMGSNECEVIKREFEAYLGRQIRSTEQISEAQRQRSEAWRKSNGKRVNVKPAEVILVDGTK